MDGDRDEEGGGSKLGKYEHWESVYTDELKNLKELGDEGENWFGDDVLNTMVAWTDSLLRLQGSADASAGIPEQRRVLDIGTGNGQLLLALFQRGYTHLTGADYSGMAVRLAAAVAARRGVAGIRWVVDDLLASRLDAAAFDLLTDKGTLDAVGLRPDAATARARFRAAAHRLLALRGLLVLTSCNSTVDELETWRIHNVRVPVHKDAGKDDFSPSGALLEVQAAGKEQPALQEPAGIGTAGVPGRPSGAAQKPVIIVGSGPAGLFAALRLAEAGVPVVLLERGEPVEQRGRAIGAMAVRGVLLKDSNYCYGEGGAGTWSDGKLTTQIGRNSRAVRKVLETLVGFGAPEGILVSGKPHLGTDRLVLLLRAFRQRLAALGVYVRFGSAMADLLEERGRVCGVRLRDGSELQAAAVVLAIGHTASRDAYPALAARGVAMVPKPFALGFRMEHPQALIDRLQLGAHLAPDVQRGKGRLPVADYRLAADVPDGEGGRRSIYSFCMCPGGQVVCTSTDPQELCVNGMSFSRRDSRWANSALVVSVDERDWAHLAGCSSVLPSAALQLEVEREAARRGGGRGDLTAPVQRLPDYLSGEVSSSLPSTSYRQGVRSAPLHDLYAPALTAALKAALARFETSMPGLLCDDAVLYGAETRTSSPLQIVRDGEACESVSHPGLFPAGEGAGYAGGIVSASVDGARVAAAVLRSLAIDRRGEVSQA
ncbi:hypothetical protein WJX81_001242 [Elliptochloris bilobata]|uniref:Protein-lysine N-methyltransferase WJX81_001242 n=1 Tax=Elliptochloris bilobata TaxID=381761 RepID=A0AAW1QYX3_9CHLO